LAAYLGWALPGECDGLLGARDPRVDPAEVQRDQDLQYKGLREQTG
jgi:hypothetical protein